MAISTGIDIVNVNRIKNIITEKKDAFLTRIFSEAEIAYCEKKVNKYQHYAARFAAKEAFLKAFPQKTTQINYKDIEVHKELEAPYIHITNEQLKQNAQFKSLSVSIAHEKEFAVASVVIEYS